MSEALRLPGVVDVITAEDIPGKKVRSMFGYHEELLAESEVKCVHLFMFLFSQFTFFIVNIIPVFERAALRQLEFRKYHEI